MYQWNYGTPLSGLSFPMVTASGTYAKSYAAASLSAVISKDGGAWASLGSRISGIPGDGVYTIASLSSTEMTCYTWLIKITANSGCLDQSILGVNLSNANILSAVSGLKNDVSGLPGILAAASGPVVLRPGTHTNALVGLWGSTHTSSHIARVTDVTNAGDATVDVSSIAAQVWNSLKATYSSSDTFAGDMTKILVAVSGLTNDVSGIQGVLAAVSGLAVDVSGNDSILIAVSNITNNVASGFLPVLAAVSGTNTSAIADQVWNTVKAGYTSTATYGGMLEISGLNQIYGVLSGLDVNMMQVSGLTPILTQASALAEIATVSGLTQILTAISGLAVDVSAVNGVLTAVSNTTDSIIAGNIGDELALVSGTVGHTLRLVRWFAWEDLKIDKTYLPNRLYLKTDDTNYSSWWSLIDNVNNTERIRGG